MSPQQLEALPPGQLTPHFSLAEMTASATARSMGIANVPNDAERAELTKTAQLLERIRALLGGAPIIVSSGFRNEQVNRAVGGATNSAHRWGGAADFTAPAFGDPLAICRKVEPMLKPFEIDQLIFEGGWVHVGRAPLGSGPRAQAFTIQNGVTGSIPFPDTA